MQNHINNLSEPKASVGHSGFENQSAFPDHLEYLGGVNVSRLEAALSQLGCSTCGGGGLEEMAARMSEYVNQLTAAVLRHRDFLLSVPSDPSGPDIVDIADIAVGDTGRAGAPSAQVFETDWTPVDPYARINGEAVSPLPALDLPVLVTVEHYLDHRNKVQGGPGFPGGPAEQAPKLRVTTAHRQKDGIWRWRWDNSGTDPLEGLLQRVVAWAPMPAVNAPAKQA